MILQHEGYYGTTAAEDRERYAREGSIVWLPRVPPVALIPYSAQAEYTACRRE